MLTTGRLMTTPVITIREDGEIGDAADIMVERKVSCLPVLDEKGKLAGIITHTDFGLRHIVLPHGETINAIMGFMWSDIERMEQAVEEIRKKVVKDVMSKPVTTVEEETPISTVLELMLHERVHRLPVMHGDEVVGIITRHDLLKLMTSGHHMLAEIWTPAVR